MDGQTERLLWGGLGNIIGSSRLITPLIKGGIVSNKNTQNSILISYTQ
jgi:hypothetical protein